MQIKSDKFTVEFSNLPDMFYFELFHGYQRTGIAKVTVVEYPAFNRNVVLASTPVGIINDNPNTKSFQMNTILVCKEEPV